MQKWMSYCWPLVIDNSTLSGSWKALSSEIVWDAIPKDVGQRHFAPSIPQSGIHRSDCRSDSGHLVWEAEKLLFGFVTFPLHCEVRCQRLMISLRNFRMVDWTRYHREQSIKGRDHSGRAILPSMVRVSPNQLILKVNTNLNCNIQT